MHQHALKTAGMWPDDLKQPSLPDDLTIDMPELPAALRRERTPEAIAAASAVVAQVLNGTGKRVWIMPNKERVQVARLKLDFPVENEDAPVEGEMMVDGSLVNVTSSRNMAEFATWFQPKLWKIVGLNYSGPDKTCLHLEQLAEPRKAAAPLSPGEQGERPPKAPRAPRSAAVKKWYIVNSHLGLMLKAHGFTPISNEETDPLTFGHPAGHEVTIKPCAPDKKSSSDWQVRLVGKEPVDGRGVKLNEALEGIK